MINSNENNKYHYIEDDGKIIRVRKKDGTGNAMSPQSALLRKMKSDFDNSKECINFIDKLRG
mgnify:CR=1 FL=1